MKSEEFERLIVCPKCGNRGTDSYCKDFVLLDFGKWRCKKCGHEFSAFRKPSSDGTDWRKIARFNINMALSLMDKSQREAVEILVGRKKRKRER